MKNNEIRLRVFALLCLPVTFIFLLACSEQGAQPQAEPGKKMPQPGMHVYKDPLTGEFITQPPASSQSELGSQPQLLPSANGLESTTKPPPHQAQEYESPTVGGGILLDLPAPYSDSEE